MKDLMPKFDKPSAEAKPETAAKPETEKLFSLKDFLVEPKIDYSEMIRRQLLHREAEKRYYLESHSTPWGGFGYDELLGDKEPSKKAYKDRAEAEREHERMLGYLKEKLQGKILVDLGAGKTRSLERIAVLSGVKTYVRVDRFHPLDPEEVGFQTRRMREESRKKLDSGKDITAGQFRGDMQVVTVKSDMLDFISRAPDTSVCISISGIDDLVIGHMKYHEALIREIGRTLAKGGIAFGVETSCLKDMQGVLEPKFEPLEDLDPNPTWGRYNRPVFHTTKKSCMGKETKRLMASSGLRNVNDQGFKKLVYPQGLDIIEKEK